MNEIDRSPGETDQLISEAAALLISRQFGSVSLLQRQLNIGLAKALRVMDRLELDGVVGPGRGSTSREVLIAPNADRNQS